MLKVLKISLWGFLLIYVLGCASTPKGANSPAGMYQSAEKAFQNEDYLIAMDKFREVKNRYPYSKEALQAELRVADTYFQQENFAEAQSAYEIFGELHPSYEKADYVAYRNALSYFKQIPDNSARDLSAAHNAVTAFHTFNAKFPSSSYQKEAIAMIRKARRVLASHDDYVGDFYFRRKQYLAASYRYVSLLKNYPKLGYDEEALYRLGQSYYHIRMYDRARDALQRLVKGYPSSSLRSDAQKLLGELPK